MVHASVYPYAVKLVSFVGDDFGSVGVALVGKSRAVLSHTSSRKK